ncbi:hypothetical protein VAWG007_38190 [Aeromonas enteropelogenes]|nr:hypothetical protein VAWG007_38190 [Aeromonas enteropelogenes]
MHNVVAVAGGTNACWPESGKNGKHVPSGIDAALKNGASAPFFVHDNWLWYERGPSGPRFYWQTA